MFKAWQKYTLNCESLSEMVDTAKAKHCGNPILLKVLIDLGQCKERLGIVEERVRETEPCRRAVKKLPEILTQSWAQIPGARIFHY